MKHLRNQIEDLTWAGCVCVCHSPVFSLKPSHFVVLSSSDNFRQNLSHLPLKRPSNKLSKLRIASPKSDLQEYSVLCHFSRASGCGSTKACISVQQALYSYRFVLFLHKPFQYHPAGEKHACKYLAPFLSLDSQEKSRGQFPQCPDNPTGMGYSFPFPCQMTSKL